MTVPMLARCAPAEAAGERGGSCGGRISSPSRRDTCPLGTASPPSVTLKVGDNITTDHIMPAGAKILPYRSNIPKLSELLLCRM